MKNYWLHRISHEWEISYPLLNDKGYLSYGWNGYCTTDLLEKTNSEGKKFFEKFMQDKGNTKRSRYSLWRFFNFKEGDIVVVPLFNGNFCICEVIGNVTEVVNLPFNEIEIKTENKTKKAVMTPKGFCSENMEYLYDIGYVVPVKIITPNRSRSFADAQLISRMKIRQSNADINDLSASVDLAINAESPVNVYDELINASIEPVKNVLDKYVTPDNLEHIIKNYMIKKGADRVWIPAKNEKGKEDGADADIIAEFNDLHLVFYIQVKKHRGNTNDWAVKQISEYCDQKQDSLNDYIYIPWAVSTAEFSEDAVRLAQERGVRLISGSELVGMLMDAGFSSIIG